MRIFRKLRSSISALHSRSRYCQVGGVAVLLLSLPLEAAAPPTQIQAARRFLLAVLHGEFQAAQGLLAPEVGKALTPAQFRAAARPLYEQGQHFGPTIDLYKFGFRLRDGQQAQPFVAFMFKSDTVAARPQVQLDVTFRDSTARQILSFGLVSLRKQAGK